MNELNKLLKQELLKEYNSKKTIKEQANQGSGAEEPREKMAITTTWLHREYFRFLDLNLANNRDKTKTAWENYAKAINIRYNQTYQNQNALKEFLKVYQETTKLNLETIIRNLKPYDEQTIRLKNDLIKKLESVKEKPEPETKPIQKLTFKACADFPFKKGCIHYFIREIQRHIGAVGDGKYGTETEKRLISLGYDVSGGITREIYDKIKNQKRDLTPEKTPSNIPPKKTTNNTPTAVNESFIGDIGSSIISGLRGAGTDMLREYVIKFILSFFNLNERMASALSTILAQYDLRKLLTTFKSKENCLSNSPELVDAVLEAFIGQIQHSDGNTGNFGKMASRNIFGEVIQDSNLGEKLSEVICNTIWKN